MARAFAQPGHQVGALGRPVVFEHRLEKGDVSFGELRKGRVEHPVFKPGLGALYASRNVLDLNGFARPRSVECAIAYELEHDRGN